MKFRIWLLIIVLALSFLALFPFTIFEKGVIIKSVEKNSTAFDGGLRAGEIIKYVNEQKVESIGDYSKIISEIFAQTDTTNITEANETKIKLTVRTKQNSYILFTNKPPEIVVAEISKTKIKTGLDLSGGARALVKPVNVSLSTQEIAELVSVTSSRLNVYGLSDITLRPVKDLQGNNYMLVEIAGATPSDLRELVGKQGKFEAKIGNETVFIGGKRDISSVCRNDATCSGIETCSSSGNQEVCRFRFVVYLSEDAAKRHAEVTNTLGINVTEYGRYLDKKLDLYLDDVLVDSLLISEDLKGRVTTQVQVQGSGSGATRDDAFKSAEESMHKLQTVLITGSLPYKLEIVKLDSISPVLGKEFTKNIMLLGLIAFIFVSVILFIKYRRIKITLSVILTMFSEAFITLAIAALIKWNLDAPSIAGIIAGIGTGVNDQIVMIDESVSDVQVSIKERIKRAFFVILGAFFTIIAAMLPLFWVGAGMLRGFALTTIIDVSVGILITRPAFAEILKKISA